MFPIVTLPVVMALSWTPALQTQAPAPAPAQQQAEASAQAATVTCPLTGEEIPSCCCPVKE